MKKIKIINDIKQQYHFFKKNYIIGISIVLFSSFFQAFKDTVYYNL